MDGIPMGTGVEVTEMKKPCACDQSDDLGSRPHVSTLLSLSFFKCKRDHGSHPEWNLNDGAFEMQRIGQEATGLGDGLRL